MEKAIKFQFIRMLNLRVEVIHTHGFERFRLRNSITLSSDYSITVFESIVYATNENVLAFKYKFEYCRILIIQNFL